MKVMIKNALGEKVINHYLPMSPTNAQTFAEDVLDGTFKVFEEVQNVGTDVGVVSANFVRVQLRDSESQKTAYLSFIGKANKSTDDIRAVLKDLTVNGVKMDTVTFVEFAPLTFA